ncbi:MAG: phosphoribosylformylglycinamidine cyclo-ligase [Flammeovirgaceae bacterium]|nr:phosphoribosylformylglycinamidine cyclo-ligase [Flammeovirgaceae bacterium]
MSKRYLERGVSAQKEDVHNAIKNQNKGLFDNTFCKIVPDILSNDPEYCNVMHADGAGTKSALAYLYWKETGDISVWRGIAQDSLIMNIDDLICVGATNNIIMSSTIGRNKHLIPGEVISEIIEGNSDVIKMLNNHGINIVSAGGETADVGDITKTILVDSTVIAREKRNKIVNCEIKEGNVIVGLSSYGMSSYESEYNSGIGSNGLTSARHDILSKVYAEKYPETYSSETNKDFIYCGNHLLTDDCETHRNIGKLLLSPTRTYAPIILKILENHFKNISGIIHCTGGGQTKVLHFTKNKKIIKNNLFEVPEVFKIIQKDTNISTKEMFEVFNMGHRMEIYCDQGVAQEVISISKEFKIDAKIIGHVEKSNQNTLVLETEDETVEY